jgi:hypothetical protein
MSELATVTLPDGLIQVFQGGVTLWQTSATAWSAASIFQPVNLLPNAGYFDTLAACRNADGVPQVWGAYGAGAAPNSEPNLFARHKVSTAAGAGWTAWAKIPSDPAYITGLSAARLADGHVQLFATVFPPNAGGGTLQTCWQSSPNAQTYTAWELFSPGVPEDSPVGIRAFTTITLADGRTQLWSVTAANQLLTCHKVTTAAGAPWSIWSLASPKPANPDAIIAGGLRPDGRVQLWWTAGNNQLLTSFQTSPPSTSLGAWTPVALPTGMTEAVELNVATLDDGRLQLFVVAQGGGHSSLYTQYQTGVASNAPWSAWEALSTHV